MDRTRHSLYIPIAILLVLLLFIHSAGIAFKRTGDTAQTLFKRADTAMYQAKSGGKGHCRFEE